MMPSVSPSQFAATSTLGRCLLALADSVRGDTVNTAERMESHGEAGRIQVSESTYELIKDTFTTTARGAIDVKGKGTLNTHWLEAKLQPSDVL